MATLCFKIDIEHPAGASDHKYMCIHLSITQKLLTFLWRLVSTLRSSHHQATAQEHIK